MNALSTPATRHRSHRSLLVLAVLGVHVWLLSQAPAWWSPNAGPHSAPLRFETRNIDLARVVTPAQPAAKTPQPSPALAPQPQDAPPAPMTQAPQTAPPSAPGHPSHQLAPSPAASSLPLEAGLPNPAAPVALPERAASAVDLPPFQRSTGEGQSGPTAAHAPPSTTLRYAVNGTAKGLGYHANAVLQWKNTADRYEASLEVGAFLLGSRAQTSSGRLSPEGLMPERFSDKNRSELAAHFQRDKGLISFSANTPEVPLLKGAQDRLSVVLQLSALLAADPTRYPIGTMLSFQTVSQREAEVWQFKVVNEETLDLPYGAVPSLKLQRNPRRDFDQRIELWFAPALDHLPVRLRITNANGDTVDQLLRSVEPRTP